MKPRVRRGVVEEDLAIRARDPAVTEDHIGDVAHALDALRREKIAGRLVGDDPRTLQVGEEEIQHIAQAGRRVAHAVGKMQPALRRPDGRGAEAVLDLLNGVVLAVVDDDLAIDDGLLYL